MESVDFIINVEKLQWDPSTAIKWLGFLFDCDNGEFTVPGHKISSLNSQLLEITKAQLVTSQQQANVVGKIILMSLAVGLVT